MYSTVVKRKRRSTGSSTSSAHNEYKRANTVLSPGQDLGEADSDTSTETAIMAEHQAEEVTGQETANIIANIVSEKLEAFKQELTDSITNALATRIDKLETDVGTLTKDKDALEARVTVLESKMQKSEARMVEQEQYSRKTSVRIFGLEETGGENLAEKVCVLAKETLGVNVEPADIIAAHRLPAAPNAPGPRPAIVKFLRRAKKDEVILNRKKLKGKRIGITDDLCREYHQVINRVSKDQRVKSCWYWNGKIFLENHFHQKGQIRYGQSLDDALNHIGRVPPAAARNEHVQDNVQ